MDVLCTDIVPAPCPFCGTDKVDPNHLQISGPAELDDTYCVTCWQCEVDGPDAGTARTAVVLWNKRV